MYYHDPRPWSTCDHNPTKLSISNNHITVFIETSVVLIKMLKYHINVRLEFIARSLSLCSTWEGWCQHISSFSIAWTLFKGAIAMHRILTLHIGLNRENHEQCSLICSISRLPHTNISTFHTILNAFPTPVMK